MVYRQSEIPVSIREKLGYPGIQDIGIDGIAVNTDGKLIAYQAKFRSDRNNTPTLRELSTFFTVSDRADWRIAITNANSLPTAINERIKSSRILADRFDQLDTAFFERLRLYLLEKRIEPQKRKTPHQTQKEAINAAINHFETNSRGQMILPCGTGKTLVSMWIAEKLEGNRILVMVPSLSLLSQTLREWASNTSLESFRYLCLCSDTTVDLGKDSPIEQIYEMDVPVSTDAELVSDFLKHNPAKTSVLFSTYQSSKVLTEAVKDAGVSFDIAIFDEAHRTTGSDVGIWNKALDDENVPIKRRIFMTATPRIYAPHISKRAKEKDIPLYSMDDHNIYGEPFYEMTFGQAIERNLISDYKVVIICVTDREVREIIQCSGRVIGDDDKEWDAKEFAKQVALVKAIDAYNLKKIFTFHSRVANAKAFTRVGSDYGINQAIEKIMPALNNEGKIKLFHINGTMSSGFRNSIMKEFWESGIGIMSNARCLIEGVDVPAVDTIAFIEPKKSIIDIVQASGRALRKADWKEKGYVFVPVVVDENMNPEDLLESSDFDTVWEVLQAMMDQDQRLESIVSQLRTMQGEGKENAPEWKDAFTGFTNKVEFYNLPEKIEYARFAEKLYLKTIEMTSQSWDFWYGLTLRYKEQTGIANAPGKYVTPEGYRLGRWQQTQKQYCNKGKLLQNRAQRLEAIGFEWGEVHVDEYFERGFAETLIYKEQTGYANTRLLYKTVDGYLLGRWQENQNALYMDGKLLQNRIQRLEAIEFKWCNTAEHFEKGFSETLKYKEQTGEANVPKEYRTPDGYCLWRWQNAQNALHVDGKLAQHRIQRLEQIGFKWELVEEYFEKGIVETFRYKEQHGDANVPFDYKVHWFNLGRWQDAQRANYKKDRLDVVKIQRLEGIGFKWDI